MFPPSNKVVFVISPKISVFHVPNKFYAIVGALAVRVFFVDVVSAHPLGLHYCQNVRVLLRVQKEQMIFR